MRSPDGSVKRMESLCGRCCWKSPRALALEPVSELVTVCSNVARAVFTLDHAATARSSALSLDCAASDGATATSITSNKRMRGIGLVIGGRWYEAQRLESATAGERNCALQQLRLPPLPHRDGRRS